MTAGAPRLILTALATSGLRPNLDHPLELGLLAVDRETFEPVDLLTIVLRGDPSSFLADLDPKVVAMHSENGLLEEMIAALPATGSFDDAAKAATAQAVEFIETNGATGECRSPLICFGTDWLRRWLGTRFAFLATQFKGEIDLTTVLGVQGRRRQYGNGRVESTLTEAFAVLKSIQGAK